MAVLPYINYDPAAENRKIQNQDTVQNLLVKAGEMYATGGMSAVGGPMSAKDAAATKSSQAETGYINQKTSGMKADDAAQALKIQDEARKHLYDEILNPDSPFYNPPMAQGYAYAHGIDYKPSARSQPGNDIMTPGSGY